MVSFKIMYSNTPGTKSVFQYVLNQQFEWKIALEEAYSQFLSQQENVL